MAWVDTNGLRIAKSEKARLKPSYKSIFRRADATPEIFLHVATCDSIFGKIICNCNCEVKFIILLRGLPNEIYDMQIYFRY